MFEDSLFASGARRQARRGWTAAVSFAVQTMFLGTLLAVPMLFTDVLPLRALKRIVEVPPAGPPPPNEATPTPHATHTQTTVDVSTVRVPPIIPKEIVGIVDPPSPPIGDIGSSVPFSTGPNVDKNGPISLLIKVPHPTMPTIATPAVTRTKVSTGVERGLLVHEVRPVYPPLASQARVQGEVILQAIIGKDGSIQQLRAVSGRPVLIPAALDAVRQWRYRPYLLNGEPVEVETQIIVNFKLS